MRFDSERSRRERTGNQAVAYGGIEIAGAFAQPVEMERRAFGRGDDEGRGAGAFGLRNFDVAIGAERGGDPIDGVAGFAALAFEIARRDGNAKAIGAAIELGQ